MLTWKIQEAGLEEVVQTRGVDSCGGEASWFDLVQPQRVLVILHPPTTGEEELGEGDL